MNQRNNRKYWGEPTWYLFHGIAANVESSYYKRNYNLFFDFIKMICDNLPCPFCRKHAIDYIKNTNISSIDTKEKLIQYLYDFHNYVNKRNGTDLYNFKDLDKYEKMNLSRAIEFFNYRFFKTYYNFKTFDKWRKSKLQKYFIKWINDHKSSFGVK